MHLVPDLPWSTVATDIFEWHNKQYLVIVDSHSGWHEIDLLRDLTSAMVVTKLKRHFLVHGAPHTLISDNWRQFTNQCFKTFVTQWDFKHVTSSPEFSQSNELTERAVRKLMEKPYRDGTEAFLNLLNLRNIPRDAKLRSPAQRQMVEKQWMLSSSRLTFRQMDFPQTPLNVHTAHVQVVLAIQILNTETDHICQFNNE